MAIIETRDLSFRYDEESGLALGGVSGALTANLPAGREKMKRRAA